MNDNNPIVQNYQEVQAIIEKTCLSINRSVATVRLIVVSKFQPAEKICSLLKAGQRDFAESRIEEVEKKWLPLIRKYPDIRLHFIGTIQSRKIRKIVQYCDYIHSLDRTETARKIAEEISCQQRKVVCLIQINIGDEDQKSGVSVADFPEFLKQCRQVFQLPVCGIMCLPPFDRDPLSYFNTMQQLLLKNNLVELSMGMSHDFSTAILCGATMIRVGTRILGDRT